MKSKNKWIFGMVAMVVILLTVVLSIALPGRDLNEDNSETTPIQTENSTDTKATEQPPVTIPAQITSKPVEEGTKSETKETDEPQKTSTKESETTISRKEEVSESKEVSVTRETTVEVTTKPDPKYPKPKDIKAKAVYLNAGAASDPSIINYIIDLAQTTELNAVVIDIKDGPIYYKSKVDYAQEFGLYADTYNPEAVISKLHDNGVYVIGRLVCFRDPALAVKKPELAIQTQSGTIWKENGNTAWLNPYHPDVSRYLLDLAVEAVEKGFDEIQFDYVRFPTGTGGKDYYGENLPTKTEAIEEFLNMAVDVLKPYGVKVTADIFGIVGLSEVDGKYIGQHLETVGMNIDYICPMVYPSHYANATKSVMGNGTGSIINNVLYQAPDLNPYEIVYGTLIRMRERITDQVGYKAGIRPYLQAFTASYLPKGYYQKYGPDQIRQQIQAVYDAGYEEWILWDHNSSYPKDAFLPKQEQDPQEEAVTSKSQTE